MVVVVVVVVVVRLLLLMVEDVEEEVGVAEACIGLWMGIATWMQVVLELLDWELAAAPTLARMVDTNLGREVDSVVDVPVELVAAAAVVEEDEKAAHVVDHASIPPNENEFHHRCASTSQG